MLHGPDGIRTFYRDVRTFGLKWWSHCAFLHQVVAPHDWEHAPEYVEGMWRMLQAPTRTTSFSRRGAVTACTISS
jgi:hypothetical protein